MTTPKKKNESRPTGDTASYVDENGRESNALLDYELTEGVDYPNNDCMRSAREAGMPEEVIQRIWGKK
jgi:hypothetical protein